MVDTIGLVNNIRNHETCFEAGFTVSDSSFNVVKINQCLISANPTSNLTFGFLIDRDDKPTIIMA